MSSRFTEQETESYYDSEDAIYRSFWDEDGSVHWGFFDESSNGDFMQACSKLNHMMVEKGRINETSRVLTLDAVTVRPPFGFPTTANAT